MTIAPRRLYLALAIVAIGVGLSAAVARAWLCDDAFISFRYADNLVHGHGLVFNAGERVEGETNFLWTLWIAAGLKLGSSAEAWTTCWGLACYGVSLALLAWRGWSATSDLRWPLPTATIVAAVHVGWIDFATSGLETSAFTMLSLIGYLVACPASGQAAPRRLAIAGAVLALASLTRPDGVVFVMVIGIWLLATHGLRGAIGFAVGFALVWGPPTAWRITYYGDFFPNTYYAKSASLAWWSQGLAYAQLYLARYWPLLLAIPLVAVARPRRTALLELALALAYALYVVRVGGDFMFARLLVPTTPFVVLLLGRGLAAGLGARPWLHAASVVVVTLVVVQRPTPVDSWAPAHRGIVDERAFYVASSAAWARTSDERGARLAVMFDGLPITVGFFGSEARMIYRSRVATAIECETGLTDPTIAHQTLRERGRVGHEKHANLDYVLARHTNFVFKDSAAGLLELDRNIPDVRIDMGGVKGRVVMWDAVVMSQLRARGAVFGEITPVIDQTIAMLPMLPDDEVLRMWQMWSRFYFDHTVDPVRDAVFRTRLHIPVPQARAMMPP